MTVNGLLLLLFLFACGDENEEQSSEAKRPAPDNEKTERKNEQQEVIESPATQPAQSNPSDMPIDYSLRMAAGVWYTCVIMSNGKGNKCWGSGNVGGARATGIQRIAAMIQMKWATNLPYIDLGTGRTAKAITAGYAFICAILDNDQLKCWGGNYANYGVLGYGDKEYRGDEAGEMGNNLPYVDLGTGRTV